MEPYSPAPLQKANGYPWISITGVKLRNVTKETLSDPLAVSFVHKFTHEQHFTVLKSRNVKVK